MLSGASLGESPALYIDEYFIFITAHMGLQGVRSEKNMSKNKKKFYQTKARISAGDGARMWRDERGQCWHDV